MGQTSQTNYNFYIYSKLLLKIWIDSRIISKQNTGFWDFYIIKYKDDDFKTFKNVK